jgi:hypothetical protein
MADLTFSSCTECRFFIKISNMYCYHPLIYGTKIEDPLHIPDWCPLLRE